MPGDDWQQFAGARAYYGFMWGYPGKKLLFMGQEFGQRAEWNFRQSLDWHLLQHAPHAGMSRAVADLNRLYRDLPALHRHDCEPHGFQWIVVDDAAQSVFAWLRRGEPHEPPVVVVCNFTPCPALGIASDCLTPASGARSSTRTRRSMADRGLETAARWSPKTGRRTACPPRRKSWFRPCRSSTCSPRRRGEQLRQLEGSQA